MLKEKFQSRQMDMLFQAILRLENIEECYDFFEDLCTITELEAMSQRFDVAALLKHNMTFAKISEVTGASPATITRVNKCLKYGEGYAKILDRLDDGEEDITHPQND